MLYNNNSLLKGNTGERRYIAPMNSYSLIWLLLQEIERLKAEIQSLQNKLGKE